MRSRDGYSLTELLTAMSIIGLFIAISIPMLSNISRKRQLHAASREIRSIFHFARARAIAKNRHVGVKFRKNSGRWEYALYEDGDWDGVRNDDILDGTDPRIGDSREVLEGMSGVWIDLPPFRISDPDTKRILSSSASPIRFGRSTICAFSYNGSGTPGSIFLTDGNEAAMIVRVFGATGRVRSLIYNRSLTRWETR